MRGLVTYYGGGTQFLEDRDADRRQLQRFVSRDTGGFRVRRGGAVQQAAAGDLLLLKGHSYAGNAGQCSCDTWMCHSSWVSACVWPVHLTD